MPEFFYFRTPHEIPGIFDSLFGGLFLLKGVPLLAQLCLLALAPLTIAAIAHGKRALTEGALLLQWLLLTLFLLQPWDEVFVNLQHVANLVRTGVFSFSASRAIDGTVEWIPGLVTYALHRAGLPLVDAVFAQGLAFGLAAYAAMRALLASAPAPTLPVQLGAALALVWFAPLAFNASHGFGTTAFTAAVLWAIYFLFYNRRPTLGLAILACLPGFRFEGALLTLLLGLVWFFRGARSARRLAALAPLALPFLAEVLFLKYRYGDWLPTPVRFKASPGNLFFVAMGARNLLADAVATGMLAPLLWLVLSAPKTRWRTPGPEAAVLAALALFSLAYYTSGGDWFPSYWARYLMPLVLFAWVASLRAAIGRWPELSASARTRHTWLALGAFAFTAAWPLSATHKLIELVFLQRRTLARIEKPTIGRAHYRIQLLSQLGEHLRRTAAPDAKLGTSEVGTLHFFSRLDGYDFLGVANPEIARAPLRQTPSLFRRFPKQPELPSLIFKRKLPDLLARYHPDYLYTFDYNLRDLEPDRSATEMTPEDHCRAFARWEVQLGGLVEGLYGGLPELVRQGYRPVVVSYGTQFTNLYFVGPRAFDAHVAALAREGLRGGAVSCTRPAARP